MGRVTIRDSELGDVVAIALGLGTMVGWKRIVATVGKKFGKLILLMPKQPGGPARRRPDSLPLFIARGVCHTRYILTDITKSHVISPGNVA